MYNISFFEDTVHFDMNIIVDPAVDMQLFCL